MDSNPFASIVGRYFDCLEDPPLPSAQCPMLTLLPNYSNGPAYDTDTGEWTCPKCLSIVDRDNDDGEEMFDDDEDAAFDNGEDYIAEGDSIQNQSDEQKLRVTRDNIIEQLADDTFIINPPFSKYLIVNRYFIVDQLRILESASEAHFELRKSLKAKIIALAIHLSKIHLTPSHIRLLGQRQGAIDMRLKLLDTLSTNNNGMSPIVEKMYYVGKAVSLSRVILDIMVEQYDEASPLPNSEPDETTRAAAWIYIKSKDSQIKGITKAKLKSVPLVKKNALDRAIESYITNLQNRIKPVEGVTTTDVD